VTVLWMIAGYSLAFDEGNAIIGGAGRLFLAGMGLESLIGTIPESVFMTFQMTFAIITAALITGAIADRMKFSALLWFVGLWSLLVYSPIAHWVWGGGFLGEAGVLDFAGGTVVHINCGIAGLVAAILIGKRVGHGTESMAPHNLTFSVIGASLLWVGWFGFNAGSAVAANAGAGMAMAVTQIATAAAALAWMFGEWAVKGRPSVLGVISGAVAGLVAITPASGYVDPTGALAIGIAAGLACYWGATSGVFAVEAIGGTPGLLEGNPGQVVTQIYGIAVTIAYSAIATLIILVIIKATIGLRVSDEDEREGLDIRLHGESVA
jgi:Amt family ammonium transporter